MKTHNPEINLRPLLALARFELFLNLFIRKPARTPRRRTS
jgi:hypothetical protein